MYVPRIRRKYFPGFSPSARENEKVPGAILIIRNFNANRHSFVRPVMGFQVGNFNERATRTVNKNRYYTKLPTRKLLIFPNGESRKCSPRTPCRII